MIGLGTLLIGATLTWFVCSSLVEAGVLGESAYPLYDAAKEIGIPAVKILLFLGTVMACLASANGCINDASRAWFAMSRDKLIPDFFGKTHPKYKSPYRAIIFLLPISMAFAFTGLLDSVVTFSIFSALLVYVITSIMMIRFRKMYPLGTIKRGYVCPIHPIPAIVCAVIALATLFGLYLGYWVNMIAGLVFYFLCSVWFMGRRAKFIDKENFLNVKEHNWPEPKI
jgi:ethanolamine permease